MNLKHEIEAEEGTLEISVDYDPIERIVSKVNWVWLRFPDGYGKKITSLFLEKMNGDAIIDSINWPEIYSGTKDFNAIIQ